MSELLIALTILGVIATFTIPKVLQGQQDGKYNAIAKEAMSMISGAYSAYQLKNKPGAATSFSDLTPYLNYVKVETSGSVDTRQLLGTVNCSAVTCLRLHNGAVLDNVYPHCFGGTNSTHVLWFDIDPDGKVTDGTTNGPGKALAIALGFDGRIMTAATIPNIQTDWDCNASLEPDSAAAGGDPPWFSWN